MVKYKVTYGQGKGLGDSVRFMLAYLGEDFEDIRIPHADWPKVKSTMPFGKIPVLEVDGKVVGQSKAICRYLGKEGNIAGSNNWESLQMDSVAETLDDMRGDLLGYFHEPDETKKAEKKASLISTTFPFYLGRYDEIIKQNGGYFVNGKLSWVDIYLGSQLNNVFEMLKLESVLDNYPNLKGLIEKVYAEPKIAKYIATRPPFP